MTERPPRLLSAAEAERELGIPAGTVRSWFSRRKMTGLWDMARDNRNQPLFDEDLLLQLRDRNRRVGRPARRPPPARR